MSNYAFPSPSWSSIVRSIQIFRVSGVGDQNRCESKETFRLLYLAFEVEICVISLDFVVASKVNLHKCEQVETNVAENGLSKPQKIFNHFTVLEDPADDECARELEVLEQVLFGDC